MSSVLLVITEKAFFPDFTRTNSTWNRGSDHIRKWLLTIRCSLWYS